MGMAKRQMEEFEELRHRLEEVAVDTGAIQYDDETDAFVSRWNGDAEKHAYARATILFRSGKLNLGDSELPEIRELLREILDGARLGTGD